MLDGLVVFNPLVVAGEPAVSDHGGVFVSLELPDPIRLAAQRSDDGLEHRASP